MALVGIISIMAIPKFLSMNIINSQFFSNEILNSVRYAQKLSVTTGCQVQVSLTGQTVSLFYNRTCSGGTFNLSIKDPANQAPSFNRIAPNSISISSTTFPIYFNALGQCIPSTNVVGNASINVGSHTINIVGETGYAYGN